MNHVPVAIGLVLCDLVIVDEKTRNITPVNCFASRKLKSLPGSMEFYVVAWLADGLGELAVKIVIERLDNMDDLLRVENRLHFDDPLKDKYFVAPIRVCVFPVAVQFVVSLFVEGELIAHRMFRLHS